MVGFVFRPFLLWHRCSTLQAVYNGDVRVCLLGFTKKRCCFFCDARNVGIDRLRFGEDGIAIKEMLSAEGESVSMGKNLAARGPVERWLTDVEERMMVALRDCMHKAVVDFPDHDFEDWMLQHPSQICLTVAQIFWAMDVEKCLSTPHGNAELRRFRGKV